MTTARPVAAMGKLPALVLAVQKIWTMTMKGTTMSENNKTRTPCIAHSSPHCKGKTRSGSRKCNACRDHEIRAAWDPIVHRVSKQSRLAQTDKPTFAPQSAQTDCCDTDAAITADPRDWTLGEWIVAIVLVVAAGCGVLLAIAQHWGF